MSDDDAPFSKLRVRASPKDSRSEIEESRPVITIPTEVPMEPAPSDAAKKKKRANARRKLAKLQSVPNIDDTVPAHHDDSEEGSLHAVPSYDSFSSDMYAQEGQIPEIDTNQDVEPTEEIPADPDEVRFVRVPKRARLKKSSKKNQDEADHGDDEKGADPSSNDDSDGDDAASPNEAEKNPTETEADAEKGDSSNGDVVINMEGEQKKRSHEGRLPRFRLTRGSGGGSMAAGLRSGIYGPGKYGSASGGSRFFWGNGGNISSLDEDSQPEAMELSPMELARIHASMRRSKAGAAVPGIFERQRTVVEAALIPGDIEAATSNGEIGIIGRRSKVTSKNTDTEAEMDELGNFSEPEKEPVILTLIPKYPLEELIPFLTLLAKTFHSYGAPVNRTEWNMREVSETLGVMANYSVMPTQITITFGLPEGMDAVSRTFRCDQNLVECGRLFLVEKLINHLRLQQLDLYEARDQLQKIIERPPNFSNMLRLLSMAVASAGSAALFFNGGWAEFTTSFILGFVVAVIDWVSWYSLALARVAEIVSALIVSAVAVTVAYYVPGACFSGTVLASLVWMLPGLTLTYAIRELATKNMIAGTVRMFSAFMTSLKLGFGISFGSYIPFWIPKGTITQACAHPLSAWWYFLFFFVTVFPFNVLLDTTLAQWPGQVVSAGVGYLISWACSTYTSLPSELISSLSALGVGLVGNGYALWKRSSGVVYIVSGILLLVPGSVGVKGATAFFDQDAWSGLQFSFAMVMIGFCITVGTLVADLLIFPRKEFIHFAF